MTPQKPMHTSNHMRFFKHTKPSGLTWLNTVFFILILTLLSETSLGQSADAPLTSLGASNSMKTEFNGASQVSLPSSVQASAHGFALPVWVERAISQHPSVLQALAQEQALTQELESARWQYWPNLIVRGDVTKDGPGSTIAVEIPLWTAGRLGAQTDQAQAKLSAQNFSVQSARYAIAEQVVDAWVLATQSAGRVHVLDQTLKTLARYEGIMERRVAAEVSPRVELDLLRARLGEARISRTNANTQGQIAVRRLKLLADQYVAWPEWKQTQLLDEALSLPPPDETSNGSEHPDVQRALQEVQAAEAELKKYQSEKWPEVYAGAQKNIGREPLQVTPDVYLGLRYESGRGLSKSSQANAAGARAQAAFLTVGSVRLEIEEKLQVQRQNWQNSVERLRHLTSAQRASSSVVSSYERQFIAGKRTWQDVLNSVRENTDNSVLIVDAKAQVISSWWRVQLLSSHFAWQKQNIESAQKI